MQHRGRTNAWAQVHPAQLTDSLTHTYHKRSDQSQHTCYKNKGKNATGRTRQGHQGHPLTSFHDEPASTQCMYTGTASRHGCSGYRCIKRAAQPRDLCLNGHQQQFNESVAQYVHYRAPWITRATPLWWQKRGRFGVHRVGARKQTRNATPPLYISNHHATSPTTTLHHTMIASLVLIDLPNKRRGITFIRI